MNPKNNSELVVPTPQPWATKEHTAQEISGRIPMGYDGVRKKLIPALDASTLDD